MQEDGKSHIAGASQQDAEELETNKIDCAESAAESCPVQCIQIEK